MASEIVLSPEDAYILYNSGPETFFVDEILDHPNEKPSIRFLIPIFDEPGDENEPITL